MRMCCIRLKSHFSRRKYYCYPRELKSIGKDIAYYIQGPGFELWTLCFSHI